MKKKSEKILKKNSEKKSKKKLEEILKNSKKNLKRILKKIWEKSHNKYISLIAEIAVFYLKLLFLFIDFCILWPGLCKKAQVEIC